MTVPLSHIKSLKDLQQEQYRVKLRVQQHEKDFAKKVQQLPAELAAAGVNNLIPPFLRGKVTNSALNGGKFLINKFFVTDEATGGTKLLTSAKKSGVIPLVKTVFKMLRGK